MNVIDLSPEKEQETQSSSPTQILEIEKIVSVTSRPFRKNSRTPWDTSALEGIKLKSALSALREVEKKKKTSP